jgi:hypothetical protein
MGRLAGFSIEKSFNGSKPLDFSSSSDCRQSRDLVQSPSTLRYTTIPNHPGDMPEGTLRAILKQAGVLPAEFIGG